MIHTLSFLGKIIFFECVIMKFKKNIILYLFLFGGDNVEFLS